MSEILKNVAIQGFKTKDDFDKVMSILTEHGCSGTSNPSAWWTHKEGALVTIDGVKHVRIEQNSNVRFSELNAKGYAFYFFEQVLEEFERGRSAGSKDVSACGRTLPEFRRDAKPDCSNVEAYDDYDEDGVYTWRKISQRYIPDVDALFRFIKSRGFKLSHYRIVSEEPKQNKSLHQNKTPWHLVIFKFLRGIPRAMEFGLSKYKKHDWMNVEDADIIYFESAMRHLQAIQNEDGTINLDARAEDSGLPHVWHLQACAMVLEKYRRDTTDNNEGELNAEF